MSTKINAKFQQAFWIIMTLLVVSIFILGVLIGIQGQRIRGGSVDAVAATKDRNQKIVLYLSLPIKSVSQDQVKITPAANFSVTAKGDSVIIQLKERLAYGTQYDVTLANIRAVNGDESDHDLHYTFSTAPASFYYLKRNYEVSEAEFSSNKQPDEIYRSNLQGRVESVFKASRIQEYCLLEKDLIVATINEDKTNQLLRVDLDTLTTEELALPERGIATFLGCSPTKNTYGFIFEGESNSNSKYNSVLFTGKLEEKNSKSTVVTGIDKKPLQVSDWKFAPDGTSILAHSYGGVVILVDSLGLHDTLPLGRFFDIGDFNYDGKSFTASGPGGLSLFNIPKFSHTTISLQTNDTEPTSAYPLQNSDGLIERIYNPGSEIFESPNSGDSLNLRRGNETKRLYKAKEPGSILSYRTSPNDQYLIVTIANASEIEYGAYNRRPMSEDTKTEIIEMKNLKLIKTIDGFDVTWH